MNNRNGEVSLSNTRRPHKQQASISGKLIDQSLRREQRIILRSSTRTLECVECTTRVAGRDSGCDEQLLEPVRAATRTSHCAFYRIDFGAGAEADCANLCILRLGEFGLVYQVNHPYCTRVDHMIPYNALAVIITLFY